MHQYLQTSEIFQNRVAVIIIRFRRVYHYYYSVLQYKSCSFSQTQKIRCASKHSDFSPFTILFVFAGDDFPDDFDHGTYHQTKLIDKLFASVYKRIFFNRFNCGETFPPHQFRCRKYRNPLLL